MEREIAFTALAAVPAAVVEGSTTAKGTLTVNVTNNGPGNINSPIDITFVGSTICYAFMQAAGMVNDHLVGCFRYRQVMRSGK